MPKICALVDATNFEYVGASLLHIQYVNMAPKLAVLPNSRSLSIMRLGWVVISPLISG